MGEFMAENIRENRLLEEKVQHQISDAPADKEIGDIGLKRNGECVLRELPGKADAKREAEHADQQFYRLFKHKLDERVEQKSGQ